MKRKLTHNLGLKIASVLIAMCLWIVAVNINDPVSQRIYTVAVQLVNLNALTSAGKYVEILDNTDTIRVTVRASRSVFSDFTEKNIVATADVSEMTADNRLPIELTYKSGSKIESIKADKDYVEVEIENMMKLQKRISVNVVNEPAEGYMVGGRSTDQNAVIISGPESMVSRVASTSVEINVDGATSDVNITLPVHLYDADGREINDSKLTKSVNNVFTTVSILQKKEVPIEVHYDESELPPGYIVEGKEQLSRSTVTISGVKEVVERIEKATIDVDLEGVTSDIDQMYGLTFRDASGHTVELHNATADAEKVTVVMKITMVKTIDILVDVKPGGGLLAADAICEPSFDQLVVSGPASELMNLNSITFTVDLATLDKSQTVIFDIKLPNGVTNVTGLTQVAVDVTIPEMGTRTFDIPMSQFQVINPPENKTYVISTPRLAITVSGRVHTLASMSEQNIRIVIDMSKVENDKCEATVEIIGVDNVTVISTYTVKVTFSPIIEEPEE